MGSAGRRRFGLIPRGRRRRQLHDDARQAAYGPGTVDGSAKLSRLADIVEEALSNDRKVVVFSFFRHVLDAVFNILDDVAVGPITGSVPPTKRQQLVDDFTSAQRACVLVSQIEAGGVGLNIQAASVVLLTEPQWKPSTEEQAIARCHRMGQARPVDVHRLLAEDSVDQRMLEILATKAALFDEYVRRSELKEISPDAVDVSNLEATKSVVSIAEEERRIIEAERRRLGLPVRAADPVDVTRVVTLSSSLTQAARAPDRAAWADARATHVRKFVRCPGAWADTVDADVSEGDLVFWTEWEAASLCAPLPTIVGSGGPHYTHEPLWPSAKLGLGSLRTQTRTSSVIASPTRSARSRENPRSGFRPSTEVR